MNKFAIFTSSSADTETTLNSGASVLVESGPLIAASPYFKDSFHFKNITLDFSNDENPRDQKFQVDAKHICKDDDVFLRILLFFCTRRFADLSVRAENLWTYIEAYLFLQVEPKYDFSAYVISQVRLDSDVGFKLCEAFRDNYVTEDQIVFLFSRCLNTNPCIREANSKMNRTAQRPQVGDPWSSDSDSDSGVDVPSLSSGDNRCRYASDRLIHQPAWSTCEYSGEEQEHDNFGFGYGNWGRRESPKPRNARCLTGYRDPARCVVARLSIPLLLLPFWVITAKEHGHVYDVLKLCKEVRMQHISDSHLRTCHAFILEGIKDLSREDRINFTLFCDMMYRWNDIGWTAGFNSA